MAPPPASPPDARLGALAVKHGYLTQAELDDLLIRQADLGARKEYQPLGTLLLEARKLTPESLAELLKEQTSAWEGQRILGRYRLLEKIGEGGMGAVWKALHLDLGNTVAIKLLPRPVVGNSALVERFHREARLMASVNHTNIVQAYDAGEADGQPFFVMPHLDGASVGQVLRACGKLGIRTTLSIALQIVRGLEHAHEHGMIHRDLKPDNLFVTSDGTVKILDLGLAKLMESVEPAARGQTLPGMIVGTPHYMSPEQALASASLDGRSDIYSLGCTLFQMLCGRVPFPGDNIREVLRKKMDLPAPDPLEFRPDLPPRLRALLQAMLAPRAADRPADCATLEAEIEALLEGKLITGSTLSAKNIVLGLSERETRTFHLGPAGAGPFSAAPLRHAPITAGHTVVLPRRPAQTGPAAPCDPKLAAEGLAPTQSVLAPPAPTPPVAAAPPVPAAPPVANLQPAASLPPAPAPTLMAPAPPRLAVGWFGQLVAAVILVILTILITLAVVKGGDEGRRPPPPAPGR